MTDQKLWNRIHKLVKPHGLNLELTGTATLNRIAAKVLRLINVESTTCSVREEPLTPEFLAALGKTWHTRKKPQSDPLTIVVFEYEGQLVVADGNTRVNLWREKGIPDGSTAIIITPKPEAFRAGMNSGIRKGEPRKPAP
jgi:hypothetical protein